VNEAALSVEGLGVSFGAVQALGRIDMRVAHGERRVLLGTNGAGKTTLFNVIAGDLAPTRGSVSLFGSSLSGVSAHRRARLGVARTYQSSAVFEGQSVAENLYLAAIGVRGAQWGLLPVADASEPMRQALLDAARVGLAGVSDRCVKTLSHGQRRQLEIGMALAQRPRLLLLDEPAAGLSPGERPMLIELILALPRSITLVMIEHDMEVALMVADRVTVMKDGRVVADGSPSEVRADPKVRAIYLGGQQHG